MSAVTSRRDGKGGNTLKSFALEAILSFVRARVIFLGVAGFMVGVGSWEDGIWGYERLIRSQLRQAVRHKR